MKCIEQSHASQGVASLTAPNHSHALMQNVDSEFIGHVCVSPRQAHAMDYQLVIKFWRKSLADETFLATIEGELKEALGQAAELDGYDVSAKEINLFMLTSDPRPAFRKVKSVLEKRGIVHGVSSAYRLLGGAQFTSIWPLRALRKFTLP